MNVEEALLKISKALGSLAYELRGENRAGMFSKNRLTEDLLLPVLRIILRAPDLRNLNRDAANYPYIDLADDRTRIAVQVTTERSAAKIEHSLRGFLKHEYHKKYDRLVMFLLTADTPRYTARTRVKWDTMARRKLKFDPAKDIIAVTSIFGLIQGLAHKEIFDILAIIVRSVIGEDYIDVQACLVRQSQSQLALEAKWGRYIPDIFIETRDTKHLARNFTHPVLFLRRTIESLSALNIEGFTRKAVRAGAPPLPALDVGAYELPRTLSEAAVTAARVSNDLLALSRTVATFKRSDTSKGPPFSIAKGREYVYEETRYQLEQSAYLLEWALQDWIKEADATKARVCILTGRAGQGKTNFVCDLVDKFLAKHDTPCAYVSARRLSVIRAPDLGDAVQRLIFEGRTSSFAHAAQLLSEHAERCHKPVVLIVDGLNEHHRLAEFSLELEQFLEVLLSYPHLKVFLTCRSEFFQQRFGNLLKEPLRASILLLEAHEHRLEDEDYEELVAGYFAFFQVTSDLVEDTVLESLKHDILLLRFFCEAYGARGKAKDYTQPRITNVYREQIFEIYLRAKLGSADVFHRLITGRLHPINPNADLWAVLELVVKRMLETWAFADVPSSVIPSSLHDSLLALLDEELILRRDIGSPTGPFSAGEDAINFTFDEFRDYLIAQYLIYRVYPADTAKFEAYVTRNDPKDSQIVEGVKRFLFYAARHAKNHAFWEHYRLQQWYGDVYDDEIFNIERALHLQGDRDTVVQTLRAGGERARNMAGHLAFCWHRERDPLLNVDLLIEVVAHGDDSLFDNLVVGAFKETYSPRHPMATQFAVAIKNVLGRATPSRDDPRHALFRFLVLLLPVDADANLNSESQEVFRELLSLHSAYAVGLLREGVTYKPTRHLPHVWRLLSVVASTLSPDDLLVSVARRQEAAAGQNETLRREIHRFLERVPVASSASIE